jgi:hypothetical protein
MLTSKGTPFVSLETRADRWLLELYFALVIYLMVPVCALFHEGVHAVAYLLVGYPVRGFFVSPFMSQVLGLYPAVIEAKQGGISAAGPVGGLLLGYLATGLLLGKRRSWGLFGDSALLMVAWAGLLAEPGYVISGSLAGFGDPQQISVHLGVPRWLLLLVGVGLVLINIRFLRWALRRWLDTFAPDIDCRRFRPVIGVLVLCTVVISIPYSIPVAFYIARH